MMLGVVLNPCPKIFSVVYIVISRQSRLISQVKLYQRKLSAWVGDQHALKLFRKKIGVGISIIIRDNWVNGRQTSFFL